jgi:hypothetical protein
MVTNPATSGQPKVALGSWSQVSGVADALSSQGYSIALPHQINESVARLHIVSASDAASHVIKGQILPFGLSLKWRYGYHADALDPMAQAGCLQFERFIEIAFGLNAMPSRGTTVLPDLVIQGLSPT